MEKTEIQKRASKIMNILKGATHKECQIILDFTKTVVSKYSTLEVSKRPEELDTAYQQYVVHDLK